MKRAMFPEADFPHLAFREYVYSEPCLALMFASQSVYVEQIVCTSKSSCPAVVVGRNFEEDGHRHRGQLIVLRLKLKHSEQIKVMITQMLGVIYVTLLLSCRKVLHSVFTGMCVMSHKRCTLCSICSGNHKVTWYGLDDRA
jgi:hypothetical protein